MSFVILLAPSEEKLSSTKVISLEDLEVEEIFGFLKELYLGERLFSYRLGVYKEFLDDVRECIFKQDLKLLKKLTGKSSFSDSAMEELVSSLNLHLEKAVCRYKGVAFKALDYKSLPIDSKQYIDANVLIFSNLFGVVRASDNLPYYKLIQNASLLKKIYKPYLDTMLKEGLECEFVIDLRASIYRGLFTPKGLLVSFNFYKDSKPVSHYSKHFRGLLLRLLSLEKITSLSSLDKFLESLDSKICFLSKESMKDEIIYNFEVRP
ncbi:hypothetical protein BKH43_07365 [Helicobacter sp. 13S00401-1]|uniref:peroxide stress protein YaaA n=1 Tax=Helicobacter sp. 13S00401-1 TaxID=1905758 RepID=UPI000BA5E8EA|nr:peroxide stress protein YaaA [Helicobacter sp. 13S00401-1]PAF49056.1 hypothetical protein BKH43_07365 [Helicobacter sp. 13S00401-1]